MSRPLSARLVRRLERDLGRRGGIVRRRLASLQVAQTVDPERVQGAIILCAGGSAVRALELADRAEQDWRDVLVAAGLAEDNWAEQLEREFAD